MKTGHVVLGTLAGVAAGAALGILFAPDKGSNTRKRIWSKGEAFATRLGKKGEHVAEEVKGKWQAAAEAAQNLSDTAKTK